MRFTANRRILLEYLKSMQKLVAKHSPVQELNGFLLEASDDGFLYMTATNLESAVRRKFQTTVEEAGAFVMEAKLLINILTRLGGDDVRITLLKLGAAEIRSGTCTYTIRTTEGKQFPKPKFPLPENTVRICGVKQFYSKTASAVGGSSVPDSLKGIHFDIQPELMRMMSCNSQNAVVATREFPCGGRLGFTLPKEAVMHLASVAGDEELDVGICGSSVVFMKDNLHFSSRLLPYEYINVDSLFAAFKSGYLAKVEFEELKSQLHHVCDIAAFGSVTSYVQLEFGENKVMMKTRNDVSGAEAQAAVVMIEGKAGSSYYYSAAQLKDIFKTVEGTLLLSVDARGYLIVCDKYNKYIMMPIAAHAIEKQKNKYKAGKTSKKAA